MCYQSVGPVGGTCVCERMLQQSQSDTFSNLFILCNRKIMDIDNQKNDENCPASSKLDGYPDWTYYFTVLFLGEGL